KGRIDPLQAMSDVPLRSGKRRAAHRAARGPGLERLAAVRTGEAELSPPVHVLAADPLRSLVLVGWYQDTHGAQVAQIHGGGEVILLCEDLRVQALRAEVVPDELRHDVIRRSVDLRPPFDERHVGVPAAQRVAARLLDAPLAHRRPADRARRARPSIRMRTADSPLPHLVLLPATSKRPVAPDARRRRRSRSRAPPPVLRVRALHGTWAGASGRRTSAVSSRLRTSSRRPRHSPRSRSRT